MTVSLTHLYQVLSKKLGEKEAEELITYLEETTEKTSDKLEKKIDKLDTKVWAMFITLALMILGLYATILLKN